VVWVWYGEWLKTPGGRGERGGEFPALARSVQLGPFCQPGSCLGWEGDERKGLSMSSERFLVLLRLGSFDQGTKAPVAYALESLEPHSTVRIITGPSLNPSFSICLYSLFHISCLCKFSPASPAPSPAPTITPCPSLFPGTDIASQIRYEFPHYPIIRINITPPNPMK
jgi:hypothetical protein